MGFPLYVVFVCQGMVDKKATTFRDTYRRVVLSVTARIPASAVPGVKCYVLPCVTKRSEEARRGTNSHTKRNQEAPRGTEKNDE